MSNSIFNFNFLAPVDSEIIGGPKFKLGGLHPLNAPSGKKFGTISDYLTTANSAFNFNFLTLVVSEIIGGSKIYIRGTAPLDAP